MMTTRAWLVTYERGEQRLWVRPALDSEDEIARFAARLLPGQAFDVQPVYDARVNIESAPGYRVSVQGPVLSIDRTGKPAGWEPSREVFCPTHEVTLLVRDYGKLKYHTYPIMLVDGAGYTREEWDTESQADIERRWDGVWTFQGEPLRATVKSLVKGDP